MKSKQNTMVYPSEAHYQTGVPMGMLIPAGNGSHWKVFIDEDSVADAPSTFQIVTAAEQYEYDIQQYVSSRVGELPDTINVLLIYHLPEEKIYKTIAVKVILIYVESKDNGKPVEGGNEILSFDEWVNNIG